MELENKFLKKYYNHFNKPLDHYKREFDIESFVNYFYQRYQNNYQIIKEKLKNKEDFVEVSLIKDLEKRFFDSYKIDYIIVRIYFIHFEELKLSILVEDLSSTKFFKINYSDISLDLKQELELISVDIIVGFKIKNHNIVEVIWPTPVKKIALKTQLPLKSTKMALFSDVHFANTSQRTYDLIRARDFINTSDQINYIIFLGDDIEGLGIFSGQERLVNDLTWQGQWTRCIEFIKKFRQDKLIFISIGNHDGPSILEAQKCLLRDKIELMIEPNRNIVLLENPISIEIEGRHIAGYHGRSLDISFVDVKALGKEDQKLLKTLKWNYKVNHWGPIHSKKRSRNVPYSFDFLAFNYKPDIVISGHIHMQANFKEDQIVFANSGCWIDPRVPGIVYDTAKLTLIDLYNLTTEVITFTEGTY